MSNAYADIPLATGSRFAGIYLTKIVPREWLYDAILVDYTTGKVITAVTLLSGKNFLQINTVPESSDYTELQKNAEAGDYFELKLTGIITAYGPAAQLALETYRYHEWVVIFIDQDKNLRIAGNKEQGMRFGADFKEIGKNGGNTSYGMSLIMESPCRAPFYSP